MKIIAIIQARMSSSRLPGKVLLDLGGKPMLQWVVERAARAQTLQGVAVATTIDPSDDAVADFCRQQQIPCWRGSQHDVLDRYYQAALAWQADVIVRLTADCPLLDPALIDEAVQAFLAEPDADFAANRLPPPWQRSYPIGLDVEVCSFTALARAWREAEQTFEREHVLPYLYAGLEYGPQRAPREVYRTPAGFKLVLLNHLPDHGARRWTVDTPEDLELLRQVFARFSGREFFGWGEVLALFEREPQLEKINAAVQHKTAFDVDERAGQTKGPQP